MKYPSIEQYRHLIRYMQERNVEKMSFRGTTKVHGTNARILVGDTIEYGSKNQIISEGHYGFYEWAKARPAVFASVPEPYVIFGEWAGKGIQSGVEYPKCFLVFSVFSNGVWYTDECLRTEEDGVYPISDFGTWSVEVSLDTFDKVAQQIQGWVNEVEARCPVASKLGYDGIGEGIVFVPSDTNDPGRGFKVKGEKHATTKVKTSSIQPVEGLSDFLEAVVTEARLQQGLDHFELAPQNTASFIKWVIGDVIKEDQDLIPPGADKKKFTGSIGPLAAKWFINKCNQ